MSLFPVNGKFIAAMKFSFIHAADLHLDSPFQGLTSKIPRIGTALRSATAQAYASLLQLCISRKADFLLVAGDIFDSRDRSLRAQLMFRDGLKKLAASHIHTYIVHGNHDPLDGWAASIAWPKEAHIFGCGQVTTKIFHLDSVPVASISGISFQKRDEKENLALKFIPPEQELFKIALLHGNCGGDPNHGLYAPCRLEQLQGSGFDYWALGHVHERKILSSGPHLPHIVYPGNIQGLSIRETGPRGCYLVTVDQEAHTVETEFCPLDAIRWSIASLDLSAISSIDELEQALVATLEDLRQQGESRPVICRLLLQGRTALYRELQATEVMETLLERLRESGLRDEPFIWVQKLIFDCRPPLNLEKRAEVNDLLGQILRISKEYRTILETEAGAVPPELRQVLHELFGNSRAHKFLPEPNGAEIRSMLEKAELLCIDLLETET